MANRSWLDVFEEGLREGRLPSGYRDRTVRELKDHAEEILYHGDGDNLADADREALLIQRLGRAREVAATLSDAYRRRFFPGRHPVITFVLTPIPLGFVLWSIATVSLLLPIGLGLACGADVQARLLARCVDLVIWLGFNVIPVTIALLYAWLAWRCAVHPVALLGSTALLALFFGSLHGKIQLPVGGPGTGMVFLGISSDLHMTRAITLMVAVGVVILVRHCYRERKAFA